MQNLLNSIASRSGINTELEQEIKYLFEAKEYRKGDKILLEDNRANFLYYIERGLLQNYYYQDDKKVTSWFYAEDQFITAWYSFYSQKSSFEEIECLEDCVLYRISYTNYQKLINQFPAFNNFARLLAEEMMAFLDYFMKGWSFLPAKEKYRMLKDYFPDIEQRVKLGSIASFLGITQETLSRIRSVR